MRLPFRRDWLRARISVNFMIELWRIILTKYKKRESGCALLAVLRLCSGFDMTMSEKTCCDRAGFLSV